MNKISLSEAMQILPLVAILRGVKPEEVIAIATVIKDAGFKIIEVPMNSPRPLESIKKLSELFGDELIVGAGTVMTCAEVDMVKAAGGEIIISPHCDPDLIRYAKKMGMLVVPGFYTPSEAVLALKAGADALKLFPADTLGAVGLKAMSVVMPSIPVLPVGGVSPSTMADFLAAGAAGFGLGSGLYKAGMTPEEVQRNALAYVSAYQSALVQ